MRVFSENKNKRSLWQKKTLPKGLQFAVCNFAARRLTSSSEHFLRNSSVIKILSLQNSYQLNSWIYSLNLIYSEIKRCKLSYMSMSIMIQDPVSSSFPLHFLSFFSPWYPDGAYAGSTVLVTSFRTYCKIVQTVSPHMYFYEGQLKEVHEKKVESKK